MTSVKPKTKQVSKSSKILGSKTCYELSSLKVNSDVCSTDKKAVVAWKFWITARTASNASWDWGLFPEREDFFAPRLELQVPLAWATCDTCVVHFCIRQVRRLKLSHFGHFKVMNDDECPVRHPQDRPDQWAMAASPTGTLSCRSR